ncbi:hypothetical protein [Sphingomonas sp. SAFR-052]|uniref:hypothetical protein n=1 Tax=Sphingomonas sp. SAFR-052 TaxID=3436867 RepID=UPI003F8183F7
MTRLTRTETGRGFGNGDAAPRGTEQLACASCTGVPPRLMDLTREDLSERERAAHQRDFTYRMD